MYCAMDGPVLAFGFFPCSILWTTQIWSSNFCDATFCGRLNSGLRIFAIAFYGQLSSSRQTTRFLPRDILWTAQFWASDFCHIAFCGQLKSARDILWTANEISIYHVALCGQADKYLPHDTVDNPEL